MQNKHRSSSSPILPSAVAAILGALGTQSALAADALLEGFKAPPSEARPRVWWHWMNGNVTEDGIQRDLDWMKRVGLGGVHNFDASFDFGSSFDTPKLIDHPVVFLTPEWRSLLRHSVERADQLGLEFTIATSAGWSETGGPWVKPNEAMKKLVWTETAVPGGKTFKGRLARPSDVTGPFQNIPEVPLGTKAGADEPLARYYADIAVLAYRAPASEGVASSAKPTVTSSSGAIDAALLADADLVTPVLLPFGKDSDAWIQFSYDKPQRMQSATVLISRGSVWDESSTSWLETSDDGKGFKRIATLTGQVGRVTSAYQQTIAFAPTTARIFRVVFERPAPTRLETAGLAKPAVAHRIAELVLHSGPRINRFEDKAGFSTRPIAPEEETVAISPQDAVRGADVLDLTSRLKADGSLDWTPPRGDWRVLRFGYSLTGRINLPASKAGTGFEVDKLNRGYVKKYMDAYLGEYEKALGPELIGKRGLRSILSDSYEAGLQNWTDDMLADFKRLRGYDALPWLPVLAGRVIESAAASERFLWDFRKTLGDLIADAHYAQVSDSAHARGLTRYGESHEVGRAFVGDGIQVKKTADIPMGATWSTPMPDYEPSVADADIRESASAAHLYGKTFVAAESLTANGFNSGHAPYSFAPQDLKPTADRMLTNGLNRFVLHTSVHQPLQTPGPGVGLGPYGLWFTRKETWAEQATPWVTYLARSSYLLQQGRFVADIAYLYGEDTNVTAAFGHSPPPIPSGYNFDYINADAVLNELSVKDGALVTRAGMQYRVLALDTSMQRMSVPVLRKVRDLVRAGAVVVGQKPTQTPSFADNDAEFRSLVTEVWGDASGKREVGAGKVFALDSLSTDAMRDTLRALDIPSDVEFTAPASAPLRFVHRALPDEGDLYFISNGGEQPLTLQAIFRVNGTKPELWRADTGTVTPLAYRIEGQRTSVPLKLAAHDAVFVVFRARTTEQSATLPEEAEPKRLTAIEGPWELSFPPKLGAPATARFEQLVSWTENADAGIKYFSGTATYSKTFTVKREWLASHARMIMDLGEVQNVAEVIVNGRSAGVLWKSPFRADVTDLVKAGSNRLEIRVTNLWPNRLIGDKQPGAQRIAYATFDPFKADSPLLKSGLLGPVVLYSGRAD